MVRSAVSVAGFAVGLGWVGWRVFLFEQWVEDVEYEGNVDANRALEELGEGKEGVELEKDVEKAKEKGKGKGNKK